MPIFSDIEISFKKHAVFEFHHLQLSLNGKVVNQYALEDVTSPKIPYCKGQSGSIVHKRTVYYIRAQVFADY